MMTEKEDIKYVQTTLSPKAAQALKIYVAVNGIPNQREWLRDLILQTIDYKEENNNAE